MFDLCSMISTRAHCAHCCAMVDAVIARTLVSRVFVQESDYDATTNAVFRQSFANSSK